MTVCQLEYGPRGHGREKKRGVPGHPLYGEGCLAEMSRVVSLADAGHAERALQYTTDSAMRLNITVNSKLVCMPPTLRSCTPQLESRHTITVLTALKSRLLATGGGTRPGIRPDNHAARPASVHMPDTPGARQCIGSA